MATCPECDAEIELDEFDADLGDALSCPECGESLVVSGTSPIELDYAPEDEDEEDDEDEEEEDAEDELGEEEEEEEEDWDE